MANGKVKIVEADNGSVSYTMNTDYISNQSLYVKKYGTLVLISGYFVTSSEAQKDATLMTLAGISAFRTTYSIVCKKQDNTAYMLKINRDDNKLSPDNTELPTGTYAINMMVCIN